MPWRSAFASVTALEEGLVLGEVGVAAEENVSVPEAVVVELCD